MELNDSLTVCPSVVEIMFLLDHVETELMFVLFLVVVIDGFRVVVYMLCSVFVITLVEVNFEADSSRDLLGSIELDSFCNDESNGVNVEDTCDEENVVWIVVEGIISFEEILELVNIDDSGIVCSETVLKVLDDKLDMYDVSIIVIELFPMCDCDEPVVIKSDDALSTLVECVALLLGINCDSLIVNDDPLLRVVCND